MIGFLLAAAYCVVDLSVGPQAKSYPVSYLETAPADGWADAHRTDKLVLRRIEAKEPYYIGVFEVTQRQYELVTGRNPSGFKGAMRPVECVAWETVRGATGIYPWPQVKTVEDDRFVGRLRARTGLDFDLPSEAQWELAAAAGEGAWADGANGQDARSPMNASGVLNGWGRYVGNRGDGTGGFAEHTTVGSYAPNAWGLYDMRGNVWEWCLDGKNGSAGNLFRMMRGGCWASDAEICTPYYRNAYLGADWCKDVFMGLRLVVNLPLERCQLSISNFQSNNRASGQSNMSGSRQSNNRTIVQSNNPTSRPVEQSNISPNPIAPEGRFLADPAGRVGPDGRLAVFCSHDESAKYYCSPQNDVLVTDDMRRWTLHERAFTAAGLGGGLSAKTRLYAPDGICLDGKWRLFYCTPDQRHSEGIATADRAEGPYREAHRLSLCRQFDPSIFRDDDGTLYLYWGQFSLKCAKVKDDLSDIDTTSVREAVIDAQHHHFHEGAQAFKRNGVYYLSFADVSRGGCSCIGYATGPTPLGPFTYRGVIIDNRGSDPCCNNNHGSVVRFGERWYVFYHRQSNGVASLRKACVEPIEFDADGLIREVEMTSNGAGAPLDPFALTEARLACLLSGHVRVTTLSDGQERLTGIRAGDTALWRYFDFTRPAKELELTCVAEAGGSVEVLDEKGNVLGKGRVPDGDGKAFSRVTVALAKPIACGRRAIKMRFDGEKGIDLFQLESFVVSAGNVAGVFSNRTEDLHLRDPFVVADAASGRYCLVSSYFVRPKTEGSDGFGFLGKGVKFYESEDLVNWSEARQVLEIPDWVDCRAFWAPEVHAYNGKWYIFGTVNYRRRPQRGTWTFVADDLRGPYRPTGRRSITPPEWNALDGTLWVEDGRPYMVFCHEWTQVTNGEICVVAMTDDLSAPVGEPRTLFRATDYTREPAARGFRDHVTDGPFLYRSPKSGKLFMTWSNVSSRSGYVVVLSESKSGRLCGPWGNHRVIFERDGGHGMLFRKFDGSLVYALHQPNNAPDERPKFFPVEDDGETLRIRQQP